MRQKTMIGILTLTVLFVAGCTAGHNPSAASGGTSAGFLMGLWHGVIAPVTFCISLFSDSIHFYEVHNNGNWYNFGFVLGTGIIFGSGGRKSKS